MPTIGSIAGRLTTAKRDKLPAATFGEPGARKYPMPDKSHAANAKARATQQVAKGNLSASEATKIKAKANRVLGESPGSSKQAYARVKRAVARGK